jgi:hypothetical protein
MPSVVTKLQNELCAFVGYFNTGATFADPTTTFADLQALKCKYFKSSQNVEFEWIVGPSTYSSCVGCPAVGPTTITTLATNIFFRYSKTVWTSCDKVSKLLILVMYDSVDGVFTPSIYSAIINNCLQICNCHLDKTIKSTATFAGTTVNTAYRQYYQWLLRPKCVDKKFVKGACGNGRCCN